MDVTPQSDSTVTDAVIPVATDHLVAAPAPEGDAVADGVVAPVALPEQPTTTAGALRAAGYVIPPKTTNADGSTEPYGDDEVPKAYAADTRVPATTAEGDVHPQAVQLVSVPDTGTVSALTTNQLIAAGAANDAPAPVADAVIE